MEENWHELAQQALEAAKTLTIRRWRAMANRTYYALFAETHARLIAAGIRPRLRPGTWRHAELPGLVRNHLMATLGRSEALRWSQTLRMARQVREIADYQPQLAVDRPTLLKVYERVGVLIGTSP